DKTGNADDELKRIKDMTRERKTENEIKSVLFEAISKARLDLGSINGKLRSIYEEFNYRLEDFDKKIDHCQNQH
ncbi:MAG: hypothetical protein HQK61_11930, partial [Desulfamplus sp.]|nr:hypothetical protein [Desulfamplus sp.]